MAQPLRSPASHLRDDGNHAEAHLATLRQALRTADMMAGKPASAAAEPIEFSEIWAELPPAARRCFEARATRAAWAAGRGLELVAQEPVSPAAADILSERLRSDLERIEQLFAGR